MHSLQFIFHSYKLSIRISLPISLRILCAWSLGHYSHAGKDLSWECGSAWGSSSDPIVINLLCDFNNVTDAICSKQELTQTVWKVPKECYFIVSYIHGLYIYVTYILHPIIAVLKWMSSERQLLQQTRQETFLFIAQETQTCFLSPGKNGKTL